MENFRRLPTEILLDIITRLPVESIFECKLVCRPWRNLVCQHPSFARLYLTHFDPSSDSSGKLSFLVKAKDTQLHYFEYNEKNDETPPTHSISRIDFQPPFTYFKLIGSINGLVCLYGWRYYKYYIWNPVTKEYVTHPIIMRDSYRLCGSGFGYLPLTNEYKVVGLYKLGEETDFIEVAVYTLGSGKGWRNVGKLLNFKSCERSFRDGVFVDCAIYWMDTGGSLSVFDLTHEEFREHISPPPGSRWADDAIGDLGGVLCYAFQTYCQNMKSSCSRVWLLKNKNNVLGVKEQQVDHEPLGWKKEVSTPFYRRPFAFTKSGAVLSFNASFLGIYDPITSTSKRLEECITFNEIIPHKNTLIPLKELGEEDVKIMGSAKTLETGSSDMMTMKLAR